MAALAYMVLATLPAERTFKPVYEGVKWINLMFLSSRLYDLNIFSIIKPLRFIYVSYDVVCKS